MNQKERSFEMARRLKELRNSKKLSHDKLRDELQNKFGIKISRASLLNYEIDNEFHSKAGDFSNLKMNAEFLNCLADFYGVSTDYLLCRTNVQTSDANMRTVSEYTGLPVETLNTILKICSTNSGFVLFCLLLKTLGFLDMLDSLSAYMMLIPEKDKRANIHLLEKLNSYVEKESDGAIHAVPAKLEQDIALFNAQRNIARAAEEIVTLFKDMEKDCSVGE